MLLVSMCKEQQRNRAAQPVSASFLSILSSWSYPVESRSTMITEEESGHTEVLKLDP